MPTAVNRKAGTLRFVHGGPNHRQRLGCAPRGGKGSSESTTNGGVHMSKRFLMRLGKTPFEVFDGFDTLDRNTIGRNNGNLIFGMAAHKLFSTAGTVVDANRYKINGAMAAKVNDEYDGFILPLANAFRPGFEAELARTTDFIESRPTPQVEVADRHVHTVRHLQCLLQLPTKLAVNVVEKPRHSSVLLPIE